ncbi:MAG: FGGY-family carbohydrate kinase, partial [Planctomycetota bacterium]
RRCGLRAGVPIVAGCGDTAASFLACGATRPGVCVDVAGTASVFAASTDTFVCDRKQHVLGCGRSATSGLWHPYAYINGGGMNLAWFQREFDNRQLADLDGAAAKLGRDLAAPLFVPHLGGRVCPPQPQLRGAWTDLTWEHGRASMYRAVLEGVALEYRLYRETLTKLAPELRLRELRVTGGGERSSAWNAIKADALNMNVRPIQNGRGAPMGVAMLAGFGVGVFRSLDATARRWIKPAPAIKPDRTSRNYYAARLDRYRQLLRNLDRAA